MKNLYLIGFMGAGKKYHCEGACKKMSGEANRDGSAHRGTTGDGNHGYFLLHMGRIISAIWRQNYCGLFRRAQDMWFPAAEAVYSGMRMRR